MKRNGREAPRDMSTQQNNVPRSDRYKRWFDLSILSLAHLLLFPMWLLLWTGIPLMIWLSDRGPVLYRQKRIGKGGKVFTILKFRTMVPDADNRGPAWSTVEDPRVTPIGRLLRRTALDELPELLSIWKGDMSLVGPRALDVKEQKEMEKLVPGFAKRQQVLPGLTGLAQLYDPADDAHDKFHYDLQYLQRMGPWLDTRLLVLSVLNSLTSKWDRRHGKPAPLEKAHVWPRDSVEGAESADEGHVEKHELR